MMSTPVNLVAGKKYYLEAIMHEGLGDEFILVGVQLPDNTRVKPIGGKYLSGTAD